MPERRYTDDEVQQILAQAAEAESTSVTLSRERGWTLADIQKVASEAGLDPASVAEAAAGVSMTVAAPEAPAILGAPIGVARVGVLTRALTDDEWQRVVHLLRDTFATPGRESVDEIRREWRNGNLRVVVDRGGSQPRVELRTISGQARARMRLGGVLTGLGTFVTATATLVSHMPLLHSPGPILIAAGLGMLGWGRVAASRWAASRREQFDEIVRYVMRLTSGE